MISPNVETLLEKVDSKFTLVTLASRRARQINAYFGQLGDGMGAAVPPQITSTARKPLSIAFQEIGADKISYEAVDPSELDATDWGANVDPVLALLEGGGDLEAGDADTTGEED
ncbi:MAG: DNA-directed RNA polymerase subunit omega [Actinomycetia bacterium]|nr:DNA-directed RNA polymerase subunit omega [Actinomycetes bacterium]MCP4958910.1 DNA-directed RNA polymerase subunit omega [Actinomycetes bacterium]